MHLEARAMMEFDTTDELADYGIAALEPGLNGFNMMNSKNKGCHNTVNPAWSASLICLSDMFSMKSRSWPADVMVSI